MTSSQDGYFELRHKLLQDIDPSVIKQAWFTFSHLLLNEGEIAVHMCCDDGQLTYAMAVMNPTINFIGIDKNKRLINKAKELYQERIHNLEFDYGDITAPDLKENSADAIINSYSLHKIYSSSKYNPRIVHETLEKHSKILKPGGTMFIRDFSRPPPEEYVLMEMPDTPSAGDTLDTMSETDLLIWYSEHARPKYDGGCGGFFLEEMPPRIPNTRLFRLPHKWAYEFIMRKDEREKWDKELPIEYTFFTIHEFRNALRSLGARVRYSGPHWDEEMIEERFEGRFRFYDNDHRALGHPPTCFIAVSQKMKDRQSLQVLERRSGRPEDSHLKVRAMRNEETGDLVDVVSREMAFSEVLPYATDSYGRLKIYLHDGLVRAVSNSVPRNGTNIDGKRWSGHLLEPISIEAHHIFELGKPDHADTVKFSRDYIGLKPESDATLVQGPDYYPAPEYIDDRIYTYFVNVQRTKNHLPPKSLPDNAGRFQNRGVIREFDAQQVLNAIAVGMIPNARLELQILSLMEHLHIRAENWSSKEIAFQVGDLREVADVPEILKSLMGEDETFKEIKGTTGQIRVVNSIFAEEGQAGGSPAGLTSEGLDFVISDQKTTNTAVVVPLTQDLKGDIHAGFVLDTLPVPQRREGNGKTMRAPCFNIPPHITTLKQLKRFVADTMNVPHQYVIRLGESYYNHIGVTPQRIYPFAVAAPPEMLKAANAQFIPIHQYRLLWSALGRDTHFMVTLARAYKQLCSDIKKDYSLRVGQIVKERFEGKRPDWSIPMSYEQPPGSTDDKNPQRFIDAKAKASEAAQLKRDIEEKYAVNPDMHHALSFHEKAQLDMTDAVNDALENAKSVDQLIKPRANEDSEDNKKALEEHKAKMAEKAAQKPPLTNEFDELEQIAEVIEEKLDTDDVRPEKW